MQIVTAAIVIAAGLADSPAMPPTPAGVELEQRSERIAQSKRDQSVPGGLPGRSESSEEADRKPRRAAKPKAAKPADTKSKDKLPEGLKKGLEIIR